MDSNGAVGYFRIEMSDARLVFVPTIGMPVSPLGSDPTSVRVDHPRACVR
jgi:hypothetical protein